MYVCDECLLDLGFECQFGDDWVVELLVGEVDFDDGQCFFEYWCVCSQCVVGLYCEGSVVEDYFVLFVDEVGVEQWQVGGVGVFGYVVFVFFVFVDMEG